MEAPVKLAAPVKWARPLTEQPNSDHVRAQTTYLRFSSGFVSLGNLMSSFHQGAPRFWVFLEEPNKWARPHSMRPPSSAC